MRQYYTRISISILNRLKYKQHDVKSNYDISVLITSFATDIKPGFLQNQSMKLPQIYLITNSSQIWELTSMSINMKFLNVRTKY